MEFSRSLEMFSQARQLIPGGSQTNSKRPQNFAYGVYPIYIERGLGCRVTDVDGNTFIDLVGALGPINLGYGYPRVNRAIEEQLGRGDRLRTALSGGLEAARLITEVVPCAEMVRFFKDGGEATAAAARIARKYTGRELILNCGYRGWPDVWTAARNDGGVPTALESSIRTFPFNDIEALERLFAEHKDQGGGGSLFGYSPYRAQAGPSGSGDRFGPCQRGSFVMDEIVSGFRLATGGAQEYFGVVPDMACFAKGIANGMPLSAVVGKGGGHARGGESAHLHHLWRRGALFGGSDCHHERVAEKKVTDYLWEIGRTLMNGLDNAGQKARRAFRMLRSAAHEPDGFRDVDAQGNQLVWGLLPPRDGGLRCGDVARRGQLRLLQSSPTRHCRSDSCRRRGFANLAPL